MQKKKNVLKVARFILKWLYVVLEKKFKLLNIYDFNEVIMQKRNIYYCINKLFVPKTLFEARKGGRVRHIQIKLNSRKWCCPLRSVCLFSREKKKESLNIYFV